MTQLDAAKEVYMPAEIDSPNIPLKRDAIPKGLCCYNVRISDHLDRSNYLDDRGYLDRDMSFGEFTAATPEQLAAVM